MVEPKKQNGLSVKDLTVSLNNQNFLLQGISHHFTQGAMTVILGPNGVGKSSLLQCLANIHKTSNAVFLNEQPVTSLAASHQLAQQLAYLPQQSQLSFPLQVSEVIDMGFMPHALNLADKQAFLQQASAIGRIANLLDRNYTQLSGGEQARVQLARVVAQVLPALADNKQQTTVLLLDEPVAALDIAIQHKVLESLKALCEQGLTLVVVLHDINLAMRYADEVIMLKSGQLWQAGDPLDVINEAAIEAIYGVKSQFICVPCLEQPVIIFN